MKYNLIIFVLSVKLITLLQHAFALETPLNQKVQVIDGDTIKQGRNRIRLYAIDAPELKQKCEDNNGKEWNCGKVARMTLYQIILGKKVICKIRGMDFYNRKIGICYADGMDINEYMIKEGMAISYDKYSKIYKSAEEFARQNKKGIWAGNFKKPEMFRKIK